MYKVYRATPDFKGRATFPPPHSRRSEEAVLAGWGPCSMNTRRASKMKM